ncbi:S26 family signal peptidase [Leifsonia sp. Leaf336]|uniref:signal peptidase I n=1 Tax=Leifsonia sp. Leaf336 TaxID=1736341 RepID=UPI00070120DC|nr:signal peptidase I [Leifsonia sp. Leaf336]KQR52779.1 S26 family signal peptidase [Leifsonia sp. Leaf336]
MTDETLPTRSAGRARSRRGVLLFLRDVLVVVVIALLVAFLIKTFVVRSFYIPSGSMENTLQINDKILVNELQPSVFGLSRGDVVVFRDPGGWLPSSPPVVRNPLAQAADTALTFVGLSASDSDDHLVKRIIGLPGDHVVCCDTAGRITVNGTAIVESYAQIPPGQTNAATLAFNVTVPKGHLWVMGDNRYDSQDSSRNQALPGHGFVPLDHVVGRAVVISWPMNRWTWLDDYPEAFRGVKENQR